MKGVGAGLASVAAGYSVVSRWIWTIFNGGGAGEEEKSLLWIDKSDFMQEGVSWVSINWRVTLRIYHKIKKKFLKRGEAGEREEEETEKKEEERKAVN